MPVPTSTTSLRRKGVKNAPRIAILIPFLSTNSDGLPSYVPLFLRSAQGSSSLIDFLIFHNGEMNRYFNEDETKIQNIPIPSNVIFIDLKSTRSMARLLSRVIDQRLLQKSEDEVEKLIDQLERYIHKYPYTLVEFKPALGYIFEEYLKDSYTHWGYSDIDIVFGDVPRWITSDELEHYDIVTFGYGDQDRVYLRGQFTFHKNIDAVNNIWRRCSYLSELDDRFKNGIDKSFHFESAEGCYSYAVLQTKDMKVKYAVKALTDHLDNVNTRNTATDFGLYVSHGIGDPNRVVIYKAGEADGDGERIVNLSTQWFEESEYGQFYSQAKQPLQWEVGERTRLRSYRESNIDEKCMYWAPNVYQPDICVTDVTKWDTVFLIDGVLYKQRFEQKPFPGNVNSFPFYHFQEWKRSYTGTQLLPLQYDPPSWTGIVRGWVALPEGALPLFAKGEVKSIESVMGSSHEANKSVDVERWKARNEYKKYRLPSNSFCLRSKQGKHSAVECLWKVSWIDDVTIISDKKDLWNDVNSKRDITLAITLQFTAAQLQSQKYVKNMFDVVESNIQRWGDNPIVLLIYIARIEPWIEDEIHDRFRYDEKSKPYLIGCIYGTDSTATISRKALINMVEVASPTRWVISGLEVERGLSLSEETYFFAERYSNAYEKSSGNVFVIPQFAALEKEMSSIVELSTAMEDDGNGITSNLPPTDCFQCKTNGEGHEEEIDKELNQLWWELTRSESKDVIDEKFTAIVAKIIRSIQLKLSGMLMQNHHDRMLSYDKSPILMLDMAVGPKHLGGIATSELVAEVDEFSGVRCMNALRLAQLSTLGHRVLALSGAFAVSTPESRASVCSESYMESRCEGCLILDSQTVSSMARVETVRHAKTALFKKELDLIES